MTSWRVSLVSAVLAISACSSDGNTAGGMPDGSAGSSGGSAGSGGAAGLAGSAGRGGSSGVGGAGGVTGSCPASPPKGGADCPVAVSSTGCSYGDSVLPECREEWQCQCVSAHPGVQCSWVPGNVFVACSKSDAAACPPSAPVPAADGGLPACGEAINGARCGYQDGTICHCTACLQVGGPCQPVSPPRWSCAPPPQNANCPRMIPNTGRACTQAGLECIYDSGCGIKATCDNQKWSWARQPCPQ